MHMTTIEAEAHDFIAYWTVVNGSPQFRHGFFMRESHNLSHCTLDLCIAPYYFAVSHGEGTPGNIKPSFCFESRARGEQREGDLI
jgi:hypothetical protein